MRWILLTVLLAGCSGAVPAGPEEPLHQGQAPPDPVLRGGLELRDCLGPSVWFNFGFQEADERVPEPFRPTVMVPGPNGPLLATGQLEHRMCKAHLHGTDLGPTAFALAVVDVEQGPMTGDGVPTYLLALHVDRPEVVAFLRAEGVPARNGTLGDQSVWGPGWSGLVDMAMGGDRTTGVVAAHGSVSIVGRVLEVFHREGDVITRWGHNRSGTVGEVAQTALTLDPARWGTPAAVNTFASGLYVAQRWDDHVFDRFDAHGNAINDTIAP